MSLWQWFIIFYAVYGFLLGLLLFPDALGRLHWRCLYMLSMIVLHPFFILFYLIVYRSYGCRCEEEE